jgi:C4-dicarboxylate-binding protein DctP
MWFSTIRTKVVWKKQSKQNIDTEIFVMRPCAVDRTWLRVFAAAAVACALVNDAFAQEPIVIKFSHVVAPDTPKGKAADFFAKRAAELTRGRVKVEVYPNNQLYKDKEELEALQLGSVQMLAPSLSKFAPLGVKEFEAFDLPFIFDDHDDLHAVTQGPIGQQLLRKLEVRGITGLAYWNNGFKVMSANRPIRTVSDYKGLRMRIQSSKVLQAQMKAIGAVPQVLVFSETFQALQTGLVDGTENPPSNLYTQRMHEVQQHLSVTNHGYLGYAVVVNKRFWDGLPGGIRASLVQAVQEATRVANDSALKDNRAALDKVRATRRTLVHEPTPRERAELKQAMLDVHRQMAPRIGAPTVEAIYRATGFRQ